MDKQTQQLVSQAQMFQQQLQNIMVQKETLSMQNMEIERALKELAATSHSDVYKISGPILIKADKKSVEKELHEKKDFIDLKQKTLEKNELKLKEKIEELRGKLSGSGSGAE